MARVRMRPADFHNQLGRCDTEWLPNKSRCQPTSYCCCLGTANATELVRGVLSEKVAPGYEHGVIVGRIATAIIKFCRCQRLRECSGRRPRPPVGEQPRYRPRAGRSLDCAGPRCGGHTRLSRTGPGPCRRSQVARQLLRRVGRQSGYVARPRIAGGVGGRTRSALSLPCTGPTPRRWR